MEKCQKLLVEKPVLPGNYTIFPGITNLQFPKLAFFVLTYQFLFIRLTDTSNVPFFLYEILT